MTLVNMLWLVGFCAAWLGGGWLLDGRGLSG